jgi:putative membrane protein
MRKRLLKPETAVKFEEAITEVEQASSAEVVVALAYKSGDYRDVHYLWGGVLAFLSLLFLILSPFHFNDLAIIPDVVLFFFLGYYLSRRLPGMARFFTTAKRRAAQVQNAAIVAFYEDGVTATQDRCGIFFYISAFERQVEIIPDMGVDGRIPRGEWNTLARDLTAILGSRDSAGSVDQFMERFRCAGTILCRAYPPDLEKTNEIPNRPKVRL